MTDVQYYTICIDNALEKGEINLDRWLALRSILKTNPRGDGGVAGQIITLFSKEGGFELMDKNSMVFNDKHYQRCSNLNEQLEDEDIKLQQWKDERRRLDTLPSNSDIHDDEKSSACTNFFRSLSECFSSGGDVREHQEENRRTSVAMTL